jgi:hypothetical protein
MLTRLGVPAARLDALLAIRDADSPDLLELLGTLEEEGISTGSLLLAFATGSTEERDTVLAIARGEREYRPTLTSIDEVAIRETTDEFLSLDDPSGVEALLSAGHFEQCQIFLHPDQHRLVTRSFEGPGRLRGISGSGKTVARVSFRKKLYWMTK